MISSLAIRLDQPAVRRIALVLFGIAGLLIISGDSPLGWDEAVYAARVKDLVSSDFNWEFRSGSYWSDVRAPGLPLLLSLPFKFFGAYGFVARAVVVAFGVALLDIIARTLDLYWPRRVGTFAVVLIGLCPGFLATSTLAFADVPATFFGVVAVYLFARWSIDPTSRSLFLVPAALGVATMIRFGSLFLVAGGLAVIGVTVIVAALRDRAWHRLVSLGLAAISSAVVVGLLLVTRLLTTVDSPLDATRAITEVNDNPSGRWIDDLSTILRPGPVDYGFNGAFWGWSFAASFGVLACLAVLRLVMLKRAVLIAVCAVVSVAPLLLYGWSVNQFVTTYLAPIYAMGAAMVSVGLWCEPRPEPEAAVEPAAALDSAESLDPADSDDDQGLAVVASNSVGLLEMPRWLQRLGMSDAGHVVGLLALASVVALGSATFRGVDRMHDRLQGFEQVRAGSIIADDLLGPDCRLATSRVPQVSFYSDCAVGRLFVGQALFDGVEDELELSRIGQQAGALPESILGLLLLEGVSGEPAVDDVWSERIEEQSVVLASPTGRRVAVIALELP